MNGYKSDNDVDGDYDDDTCIECGSSFGPADNYDSHIKIQDRCEKTIYDDDDHDDCSYLL